MFIGTPNTAIEQLQKNLSNNLNGLRPESQHRNIESWHGNLAQSDICQANVHPSDGYSGPAYAITMSDARLNSRISLVCDADQPLNLADYIHKWPTLRWNSPSMSC